MKGIVLAGSRHKALPDYKGGEQTTSAYLRQADGVALSPNMGLIDQPT